MHCRYLPEAQISPFSKDNPLLAQAPIRAFPQEIYMIVRAMMILR